MIKYASRESNTFTENMFWNLFIQLTEATDVRVGEIHLTELIEKGPLFYEIASESSEVLSA